MVLRIPAAHRRLVVLVKQEPLLARAFRSAAHEDEASLELAAVEVEMELAIVHRVDRVLPSRPRPRSPAPDDDIAAAVLAGRDASLEVEVVEGMVLDMHRQTLRLRIERRPFRDRPAEQDAGGLQTQIVVKALGAVTLNDEPMSVRLRRA